MYTKHCSSCNKDLDLSSFSKRRGNILQSKCKECQRKYAKEHYNKNKKDYLDRNKKQKKIALDWYKEYKKKLKCEKCKENHIACLHFHHVDPSKKRTEVLKLLTFGINKMKEEIEKCIVLCANCHAKLHYELNKGAEQ